MNYRDIIAQEATTIEFKSAQATTTNNMNNQQPSTELVAELNKATISGLEDACELLRERIEELENALRKGLLMLMLSYQDGERPEHQVKNIQAQFRKQANKALWGEDYTEAELNCKGCMGPCGNCTDIVELEAIIRLGTEMGRDIRKC